mmetsp:Transcript_25442/g.73451  ORF Transcript_25442/g.73451 Transcript_25442/m.73451 type:complete len:247 (+) Transcript_25442:443-1183(+)
MHDGLVLGLGRNAIGLRRRVKHDSLALGLGRDAVGLCCRPIKARDGRPVVLLARSARDGLELLVRRLELLFKGVHGIVLHPGLGLRRARVLGLPHARGYEIWRGHVPPRILRPLPRVFLDIVLVLDDESVEALEVGLGHLQVHEVVAPPRQLHLPGRGHAARHVHLRLGALRLRDAVRRRRPAHARLRVQVHWEQLAGPGDGINLLCHRLHILPERAGVAILEVLLEGFDPSQRRPELFLHLQSAR